MALQLCALRVGLQPLWPFMWVLIFPDATPEMANLLPWSRCGCGTHTVLHFSPLGGGERSLIHPQNPMLRGKVTGTHQSRTRYESTRVDESRVTCVSVLKRP